MDAALEGLEQEVAQLHQQRESLETSLRAAAESNTRLAARLEAECAAAASLWDENRRLGDTLFAAIAQGGGARCTRRAGGPARATCGAPSHAW